MAKKRHKNTRAGRRRDDDVVQVRELVALQRRRFAAKFGRPMADNEPLFFDPFADEPAKISRQLLASVARDMAAEVPQPEWREFLEDYAARQESGIDYTEPGDEWDTTTFCAIVDRLYEAAGI